MNDPSKAIKYFIESYPRQFDHYEKLASSAKSICETELQKAAIQAQVTYRVKGVDSLQAKLHQRSARLGHYKNTKEILEDIVDLAGVRIGLYFPNHLAAVEKVIESNFEVQNSVEHGEDKRTSDDAGQSDYVERFSGYRAKHFRVFLKPKKTENTRIPPKSKRVSDMVEIQIVSMLHHTWAQVGHDLIYKQMSGSVSLDERRILDGLSGLIQVGELLLEQLHITHISLDKPFSNHFELGSFLSAQTIPPEIDVGPLDILFQLLGPLDLNSPSRLRPEIAKVQETGWRSEFITEFNKDAKQSEPVLKHNMAVTLMERLCSSNQAELAPINEIEQKCKIIVDALLILKTLLYPSTEWPSRVVPLTKQKGKEGYFNFWLNEMGRIEYAIQNRRPVGNEERSLLETFTPWSVFEDSADPVVGLAFKVARRQLVEGLGRFRDIRTELQKHLPVAKRLRSRESEE